MDSTVDNTNESKPVKNISTNKKCDICGKKKPKGFCLSEEVFGNNMGTVVQNISGIPVEGKLLTNYFACKECTISLVTAEDVAVKTRNLVKKITTPKTRRKLKATKASDGGDAFSNQISSTVVKKKPAPKKKAPEVKPVADTSEITAYDSFLNKETESGAIISSTLVPSVAGLISNLHATPTKTPTANKKTVAENGNLRNGNDEGVNSYVDSKAKVIKEVGAAGKKRKNSDVPSQTSQLPKKSTSTFPKFFDDGEEDAAVAKPKKKSQKKSKLKETTVEILDETPNGTVENLEEDDNGFAKDCPNCGKTLYTKEKYESHVFSQKCRNAIYECQYLDCGRRFAKESKMQEHMVKKHGYE